jgi:hypothetical protein
MINVSAAMGGQFAWSATNFTEELKSFGPNPLRNALDSTGEGGATVEVTSKS